MLFDTSFIIDLMKGDKRAVAKFQEIKRSNKGQSISTPSVFELFVGIGMAKKPEKEKKRVMESILSMAVMDLKKESAARAGIIYANLLKKGERIDPVDCLISGIAIENRDTLLTRNRKHFSKIKGLEVESY